MAIGNVELMHECSPEHLGMGTVRSDINKETQEEGKQKRVQMEGHEKKEVPEDLTVARA